MSLTKIFIQHTTLRI